MFWATMADGIHALLAGTGGNFAQAAASLAVAALWQGATIALVLGLCLWLAPRMHLHVGAAHRFAVWAAAFAAVTGLPLLPALHGSAAMGSAAGAPQGAAASASWFHLPQMQLDARWALAIAALWMMASLARAASLAAHSLRLRRLWKSATPVTVDGNLRALLAAVSPARRAVKLCTTRALDRPSVIGFLAPRILIPEWLYARLTAEELEHVVLHEAEHLRRRDDWSNLAQKAALIVFPLNPALAWIERRLCREREMACDEGVVRQTRAPRAYAACLASLAERGLERRRAQALSLGAFERRPELVRRVASILARRKALHPMAARALVGVAGCGLLVGAVGLARCPQMVAFVPDAHATAQATQMAQAKRAILTGNGDKEFTQARLVRDGAGYHAVETRAMVPAEREDAPAGHSRRAMTGSAGQGDGAQQEMAQAGDTAPREVLLKAQMPAEGADATSQVTEADSAAPPEVVVLTAWEVVEPSPRHGRMISDYDTDAAMQPQSAAAAAAETHAHATTEVTVTRVIFAVYPADAMPGPMPGSAPGHRTPHATGSDSGRSPAPLPQSGWLVFQL